MKDFSDPNWEKRYKEHQTRLFQEVFDVVSPAPATPTKVTSVPAVAVPKHSDWLVLADKYGLRATEEQSRTFSSRYVSCCTWVPAGCAWSEVPREVLFGWFYAGNAFRTATRVYLGTICSDILDKWLEHLKLYGILVPVSGKL
jgi:hypothetical protein